MTEHLLDDDEFLNAPSFDELDQAFIADAISDMQKSAPKPKSLEELEREERQSSESIEKRIALLKFPTFESYKCTELPDLTEKQYIVLRLLALGNSDTQIVTLLGLRDVKSVRSRIIGIKKATGCETTEQLIPWFYINVYLPTFVDCITSKLHEKHMTAAATEIAYNKLRAKVEGLITDAAKDLLNE